MPSGKRFARFWSVCLQYFAVCCTVCVCCSILQRSLCWPYIAVCCSVCVCVCCNVLHCSLLHRTATLRCLQEIARAFAFAPVQCVAQRCIVLQCTVLHRNYSMPSRKWSVCSCTSLPTHTYPHTYALIYTHTNTNTHTHIFIQRLLKCVCWSGHHLVYASMGL